MNQLTDLERGYLAGLFDGEGCVSITKAKRKSGHLEYQMVVVIGQANKLFLEYWCNKTGIGKVYQVNKKLNADNPAYLLNYQWRISSKQADEFIDLIYDVVTLKQNQLKVAQDFRSTFYKRGGNTGKQPMSETILDFREACRISLGRLNRPKRPLSVSN